jgi:hypothetical protein
MDALPPHSPASSEPQDFINSKNSRCIIMSSVSNILTQYVSFSVPVIIFMCFLFYLIRHLHTCFINFFEELGFDFLVTFILLFGFLIISALIIFSYFA